jgi:hypothetical protein
MVFPSKIEGFPRKFGVFLMIPLFYFIFGFCVIFICYHCFVLLNLIHIYMINLACLCELNEKYFKYYD